MHNIIFLDCDGVMLSFAFLRATSQWQSFDPECVGVLNNLLVRTDAKIVVSSVWRIGRTVEELEQLFTSQGVIPGRVLGKTKVLNTDRGIEIREWLDRNQDVVNRFVIVDDETSDINGHFDQSVIFKTNGHSGLTFKESDAIVRQWS